MRAIRPTCRVALVQAEPVMFDKQASLDKVLRAIDEAAPHKPDLIVFPELFIPGYPIWLNFGFTLGKRYYDASVVAGDKEFQAIAEAAKRTGAYISMGFSERDAV